MADDCGYCRGFRQLCNCTIDCGARPGNQGRGHCCLKAPNIEVIASGVRHVPGGKCWCDISHSVPGAAELNKTTPGPVYDARIRRTEGQEDPLVQEP